MKLEVVCITGGANGIGKKIAESFYERGYTVVFSDTDQVNGLAWQKHLGERAHFIHSDVRKEEDIIRLFRYIDETFGTLDVLINNAGKVAFIPILEHTIEQWDDVMNTNIRSVFLCSREAAKLMKKYGEGGAIISMASTRATMSEPDTESYAASKGAILAITHALAASLSPFNITVNCISPGWIETGDYKQLRDIDHEQHFSNRVGLPRDIAKACLFLADKQNNFINGENITIDGGMSKKMIYEH